MTWSCNETIFLVCFSVYDEGGIKIKNPNIELMDQDILYHLALGNESHDLVEMFGDVKVSSKFNHSKDIIPIEMDVIYA